MALTQIGVRYAVIQPLYNFGKIELEQNNFSFIHPKLALPTVDFILLVITTLLVAAGGYIINDYFDVKADRINRPDKLVIGHGISRRKGMMLHVILSSLGLLGGAVLAWRVEYWPLVFIQLFSVLALWFYSTHFKKQLLVGNLLIAFLACLVPLTVGIYEFKSGALVYLNQMNILLPDSGSNLLLYISVLVIGYTVFAFGANLIREIIKDMEDLEGDSFDGRKTLPYIIGIQPTKYLTVFLLVSMTLLLLFIQQKMMVYKLEELLYFTVITVQLPLLGITTLVWQAQSKDQFSKASSLCKLMILCGVLSMFVFGYFLNS